MPTHQHAIYVFRAEQETSLSTGPKALAELASKSGGRVFHDDDSDAGIYSDLQIMEGNLRDQYRLIYQPAELKRDGSFHRIELASSGARGQYHHSCRLLCPIALRSASAGQVRGALTL